MLYAEAVATLLRIEEPADPLQHQRDLALACDRLARSYEAAGQLAEALAAFEQSRALSRRVAAADPDGQVAQRNLAGACECVSRVLHALGRFDEAATAYAEVLDYVRRLAAADPSNPEPQQQVGISLDRLGQLREADGALDAAQAHYEAALRMVLRPGVEPASRDGLGEVAFWAIRLGRVHEMQGRPRAALGPYADAQRLIEQVVAMDSSDPLRLRDLAFMRVTFVRLYRAEGDEERAAVEARAGVALMERVVAIAPDNLEWREDLGRMQGGLA